MTDGCNRSISARISARVMKVWSICLTSYPARLNDALRYMSPREGMIQ